jgi:hypothetical protein
MLVSEEYRKTLEDTHRETNHSWGQTAPLYTGGILTYMQQNNFEEVLDYGSAHGSFRKSLNNPNIDVTEYDPGYPDKASTNIPKKFLVCIDVLEHVEPSLIDDVLEDIQRCTLEKAFLTIACYPARQILSDGRNAHLIVESPTWWKEKILKLFDIESEDFAQRTLVLFVKPKEK